MNVIVVLIAGALAADPAHYHPDDVAKKSASFGTVAESMGPAFEDRQAKIAGLGESLGQLEIGVAMLGAAAPAELSAWSEQTRRKVVGETLRLQRHVDLLQDDYGRVFGAALERALPAVGKGLDVQVCGATGVLAMMGRKNCPGTDLNVPLAAALDADAALTKELASIAAVEWPSFEAPKAEQAAVALTGTTRWVNGGMVAEKLVSVRIKARQDTLEEGLDRLAPEALEAADMDQALALRKTYLDALGKDGEVLRAAITAALGRAAKKGAPAEVGWCANPASLGGCPGDDVTAPVLALLTADKKFAKEIAPLAE